MQKAFLWLDSHGLSYTFHDYKKQGIDAATLNTWCAMIPWESLINTRGTSWRKLTEEDRGNLDQTKAIHLMMVNPSLIKRPLILGGREPLLGFDERKFSQILENADA